MNTGGAWVLGDNIGEPKKSWSDRFAAASNSPDVYLYIMPAILIAGLLLLAIVLIAVFARKQKYEIGRSVRAVYPLFDQHDEIKGFREAGGLGDLKQIKANPITELVTRRA